MKSDKANILGEEDKKFLAYLASTILDKIFQCNSNAENKEHGDKLVCDFNKGKEGENKMIPMNEQEEVKVEKQQMTDKQKIKMLLELIKELVFVIKKCEYPEDTKTYEEADQLLKEEGYET